ncbi:hypothetical protein GALMADRAFT_900682 [Galerina marginata CBS 339.88]|uniref:NAD-dependent epimerase/dehydratase domain-containing protein n=1 Tax=Galerina marginata (strain CBS 339.88) TaxID=685588 RepID=A0A067SGF2_GALM3|nr:hypothetical protein GALMADRAFT_900682 [Galerina marginata CBS 339.88]
MPAVEPNAGTRVLVSGANGYIAMWVVQTLLEQGYTVRGAIRSEAKGKHLKEHFKSYGDKFEWVVVEDIVKDGAFDEAVKDVDAIEHMASPLGSTSSDPNDYIVPAVRGTVGILQSALKYGNKVKRVVLTSSVAAIIGVVSKPGIVFDESGWGDYSVQVVNEQGKDAAPMMKYRASKTLAEKAAWDFYNKHKAEIGWDLVALNPTYVAGPSLLVTNSPADYGDSSSLGIWWNNVTNEKSDDALKLSSGWIHARDAAAAHVLALRKEEAGGERIIISAGTVTWQGIRNILYSAHPELYKSGLLPRGNPELDTSAVMYNYNAEKGKRILGIEYKSIDTIMKETLEDFQGKGWLEKYVKH